MTWREGCVAAATLFTMAVPAQAQHHGHNGHASPSDAVPQSPAEPHAGHTMPESSARPPLDHSEMDHAGMGHGDHTVPANPSPAPTRETPPPPEAGSGPPRAADAIWGAEAMRASRDELASMHGDFPLFWFQADRAEIHAREGAAGFVWDVQGYYGGPTRRFWFKSEGEGSFGEAVDDAEVQALFARAVAPFWDLQVGIRQDFAGPGTSYAVIGIQGLAPYEFDIDAALFVSHRGDVTARVEAELDQRITQRLILQPRAEINLAAQDVPGLGIGSGIDRVELGLRLRYEIIREFAPYVGIEQAWRVGGSAIYARASGQDPSVTNYVVGVRFWF